MGAARNTVLAAFSCALAIACGGADAVGGHPQVPSLGPARPPVEAPRLVVLLVLDQLASWVFVRHLPSLPPDGFIRRMLDRGALHHVDFPYASTLTAPGHAGVVTGTTPSVHGVASNEVYRGDHLVAVVDDGSHPVLGVDGAYASPTILRSPTVADVLRRETAGAAKVASVSFKARAAVLAGGERPDAVWFYEPSLPGFTTSSYYARADDIPSWFHTWTEQHPVDQMLDVWMPFDEERVDRVCGTDAQPGEGGAGLDSAFPHDARDTDAPYSALRYTGLTNDHLLSLAEHTADALEMGRDPVPDFLIVSVSSTDYVGHAFGPESCEYFDNLWRLDRRLAEFADVMDSRGPVSYLLTADHGVARLVERANADGHESHRLQRSEVVETVESRLDETFGSGDWVKGYVHPFLYLSEAARERDEAGVVAADSLTGHPGVYAAFETARATELRVGSDLVLRAAALGVPPVPDADVVVVAAENWVPGATAHPDTGTSHGTPWIYDRRVPVLLAGPNVEPVVGLTSGDQRQVAPTLAKLLGVPAPRDALAEPLPGVLETGPSNAR